MSFLIKQAINDLSSETSDIQVVLSQKADVAQTYTKFDTYSTAEVDKKFTDLIDSAPATLHTLNQLATATTPRLQALSPTAWRRNDHLIAQVLQEMW